MQLSATNLIAPILCIAVACTVVESLILSGLGRVHHTARELKEDKDNFFVTDPSANVKGKFPLYTVNDDSSHVARGFIQYDVMLINLQGYSRKREI